MLARPGLLFKHEHLMPSLGKLPRHRKANNARAHYHCLQICHFAILP